MNETKEKLYNIICCLLSALHAAGYVYHGFINGFNLCIFTMIFFDLLFIPVFIYKRSNYLKYYLIAFSLALIFITAFTTSTLYNNYTGLLCLFIAVLLFPHGKNYFMAIYLFCAAVAFMTADDPAYKLIIHTSRALWLFIIYDLVIFNLYTRKKIFLYDDEKAIIEQLADNKLIKEIEYKNYSERTIRRRLDAARKRNGVENNNALIELYKNNK